MTAMPGEYTTPEEMVNDGKSIQESTEENRKTGPNEQYVETCRSLKW